MIARADYKTHVIDKELEDTELHCPACGMQNVKVEQGEGDYYTGPDHYCMNCKNVFSYSGYGLPKNVTFHEV